MKLIGSNFRIKKHHKFQSKKAVFNAHWKTHEDYLKIVDQPNIYQLDPITGKKKDLYWLVLLRNLQQVNLIWKGVWKINEHSIML